jgi:hypothetical protein
MDLYRPQPVIPGPVSSTGQALTRNPEAFATSKGPYHWHFWIPAPDRAGGRLFAEMTDWWTGHLERLITEMTDAGFNQSASSSLNSYDSRAQPTPV